jgi:hypothetical protein
MRVLANIINENQATKGKDTGRRKTSAKVNE